MQIANLVETIHATPQKIVYEFAGAGAQALTWLHSVGGSSRTILEATDRYAAASLVGSIGFEPQQFASPEVARAMATQAFLRACELTNESATVAGIGCTSAIATDRTKRGDHRCCVAVCTAQKVKFYQITFEKGERSRIEEEEFISLLVLRAIAEICKINDLPTLPLQDSERLLVDVKQVNLLDRLVQSEFGFITVHPDGRMVPGQRLPKIALLSGAFNPLHHGHRQMAETGAQLLEQPVYFELPLVNADKGSIALDEAQRRIAQFAGYAPVILTAAPLFNLKAQLFPGSVFILGADTTARLTEPRFYNNDPAQMLAAFEQIRAAGCRFLVAGRLHNNHFLTLKDLSLPEGYRELFEAIPESKFRKDISSTAIRTDGKSP